MITASSNANGHGYERLPWLDFIKGVAIVLVVLHHVLLGLAGDGVLYGWLTSYPTWPWMDGIMYIFMFAAGWASVYRMRPQHYYWRKALYLLSITGGGIVLYSIFWYIVSGGVTGVEAGHLWFVGYLAIFIITVLLTQNTVTAILALFMAVGVCTMWLSTVDSTATVNEGLRFSSTALWFYLGCLATRFPQHIAAFWQRRQPHSTKKLTDLQITVLLLCIVSTIPVLWVICYDVLNEDTLPPYLAAEYTATGFIRGSLELCFLGYFATKVPIEIVDRGFRYLGRTSLSIYFWHIIFAWCFRQALQLFITNQYILIITTIPLAIAASLITGHVVKVLDERFFPPEQS